MRRGVATLAVALTLFGCNERPAPELRGAIVIVLDTVRADRVSAYGHSRLTTPHLDQLADRGTRFDSALSDAPWTLPAMSSLLMATYSHRYLDWKVTDPVTEDFRRAGYKTAAFTEGGFVSRAFGFDGGFDEFQEREGAVQLLRQGQARDPAKSADAERTFQDAAQWLRDHRDEKFFLLVHTYEPHTPYTHSQFTQGSSVGRIGSQLSLEFVGELRESRAGLTEAEAEHASLLYDSDLYATDLALGQFLDALDELGLSDEVLIVVTSDHGEELGEHYPMMTADHGHSLRDTLLRVPLILFDPLSTSGRAVVPEQVRLLDVLPTVADYLQIDITRGVDGRSLRPLVLGPGEDRVAVAGGTKVGPGRLAVRAGGFKLIQELRPDPSALPLLPPPDPVQLYDLGADPGELRNVALSRPEVVTSLEGWIQEFDAKFQRGELPDLEAELDPATIERLKSLGYLR